MGALFVGPMISFCFCWDGESASKQGSIQVHGDSESGRCLFPRMALVSGVHGSYTNYKFWPVEAHPST